MNHSLNSPALLEDFIKHIKNKNLELRINSLCGLLSKPNISLAENLDNQVLDEIDKYYIRLLRELYHDVKFYYRQSKAGNPDADEGLERALQSLAGLIERSKPDTREIFFKSISKDVECAWFVITTFTDFPKITTAYFKEKLFHYIKNSHQLNRVFKTALRHSRVTSLTSMVESVFPHATAATKQDLLDVLFYRGELKKTWLMKIQPKADPMLQSKISNLLTSLRDKTPENQKK